MLNYLALGDSYTIGEGLPLEDAWPHQLVRLMRRKETEIADPDIVAKTGWTTGELLKALESAQLSPPYDLVTLLIGVNNQYRGLSPEAYSQEFDQLLQHAINYAGGKRDRVFVVSIPDWGVTPYARENGREKNTVKLEIDAINRIAARACYREKVTFLNITELSRLAGREGTLLADDRLHYSAKMYRRWLDEILPKVWLNLFPGRDYLPPHVYRHGFEPVGDAS